MKTLDQLITALENLTICDGSGCSYIEDADVETAIYFLRNYKRIIDVLGSLLHIHECLNGEECPKRN